MTRSDVSHHRLFAYGELTDAAHRRRLLGRAVDGERAVLRGWCRAVVPGFAYPVALPTPGAAVEGVLIDGLDAWDLQVLDAWETTREGLYRRAIVTVETAPGLVSTAAAYLGDPGAVRARLRGEPAPAPRVAAGDGAPVTEAERERWAV